MTTTYFETSVTVEIAFGYGPADTPTWTDVSDYVRGFEQNRGRSDEFGSYSPGTAQIVLSNAGRRFDPSHAAGPYFGDLVPMVPLRIIATYDTVDYPLFYGFVQGWPQRYIDNSDSTVTVNCVDAFRLLEQAQLAESAYRAEVDADSPIAYYPFAGGALVDEIAQNNMTVPYPSHSWAASDLSWTPAAGIEAVTQGSGLLAHLESPAFLSDAPRAIELLVRFDSSSPDYSAFWNIVARAGSSTDNFFQVFVYDDDISYSWSNTALNKKLTNQGPAFVFTSGRTYHVVITVDSDYVGRTYVDGVLVGETAAASAGDLSTGVTPWIECTTQQAVAHFAVYDAPLSAARVLAHSDAGRFAFGGNYVEYPGARVGRVLDDIGWPSGTRDIADGGIELGEYLPGQRSALDYIREVETTEQGLFFVAADGDVVFRDREWQFTQASIADFGDTAPDLGFVDVVPDGNTVDVIVNQVKVIYNQSDSNVTVEDATSIAAYGYGSESISAPLIQTIDPARGLASFKVRVGKDPRTRVSSLLVKPRSDPASLFPAVLGAELGEVVTVSFTPIGVGSASTFTTSIQGIRHTVGRGVWDVELYLAPAVSESGPYWTIGDATLGKIGAAFGNKLSY